MVVGYQQVYVLFSFSLCETLFVCNLHKYHSLSLSLAIQFIPDKSSSVIKGPSVCEHNMRENGIIGALVTMRERESEGWGGREVGHWVVKRAHVTSGNSLPWICLLRSRGLFESLKPNTSKTSVRIRISATLFCHCQPPKENGIVPPFSLPTLPSTSQTRFTHSPIPMSLIPSVCHSCIHLRGIYYVFKTPMQQKTMLCPKFQSPKLLARCKSMLFETQGFEF